MFSSVGILTFLHSIHGIIGGKEAYGLYDFKANDFDFSQLDVVEEHLKPDPNCPEGIIHKTTKYRYPVRQIGFIQNKTIEVPTVVLSTSHRVFYDSTGLLGTFTYRHHLNCLDQQDPSLIQTIKDDYLEPPSILPYAFTLLSNQLPIADGQPIMLDQRYFNEELKGGFFIEAGAFDGEKQSTSLYFELKHGWTGLLVEPMLSQYVHLRTLNRKAWSVNTCLSPGPRPETILFTQGSSSDHTMAGIVLNGTENEDTFPLQCLPLSSLILALGNPRVDFLSLDIEGAEMAVLETMLWDKLDIRAISVETQFLGEFGVYYSDLSTLLENHGFMFLDSISRDSVFVLMPRQEFSVPRKNLPTSCRKMSIKDALVRDHYPLPSRICYLMNPPLDRLNSFCREQYPYDYYRDRVDIPACLKKNWCPADFHSLLATLEHKGFSWKLFLEDTCVLALLR